VRRWEGIKGRKGEGKEWNGSKEGMREENVREGMEG